MFEPENTYELCTNEGRCVDLHAAHSTPETGGEAAAALLLAAEETLFLTAAYLRVKYLQRGPAAARVEDFLEVTRRSKKYSKPYHTDRHMRLLTPEGRARLERSLSLEGIREDTLMELRENVVDLVVRWNPLEISEGSPHNSSKETAYTVNKGESMVYCLRDRDDRAKLVDEHLLSFVAIHELTHVFTESFEHPPRFWEHFKWLLLELEAAGIYTSENYGNTPRYYCGLFVNHNPRFDRDLVDIRTIPPDEWGHE
jgi:hypothetical protein